MYGKRPTVIMSELWQLRKIMRTIKCICRTTIFSKEFTIYGSLFFEIVFLFCFFNFALTFYSVFTVDLNFQHLLLSWERLIFFSVEEKCLKWNRRMIYMYFHVGWIHGSLDMHLFNVKLKFCLFFLLLWQRYRFIFHKGHE